MTGKFEIDFHKRIAPLLSKQDQGRVMAAFRDAQKVIDSQEKKSEIRMTKATVNVVASLAVAISMLERFTQEPVVQLQLVEFNRSLAEWRAIALQNQGLRR